MTTQYPLPPPSGDDPKSSILDWEAMMTTKNTHTDNLAVARRFIDEILNQGRFERIADLIHDDYRYIGPDGTEDIGQQALADLLGGFRAAFPDLHAHVRTAIAANDTVAMTMTLTGTHDGDFDGIPPTGARLELPLAVFTTIVDGKIVEDREYYDTTTMFAQLGVSPTAEPGDDHAPR